MVLDPVIFVLFSFFFSPLIRVFRSDFSLSSIEYMREREREDCETRTCDELQKKKKRKKKRHQSRKKHKNPMPQGTLLTFSFSFLPFWRSRTLAYAAEVLKVAVHPSMTTKHGIRRLCRTR